MVTIVGQDTISAKRDLRDIFPKEFSNRLLINEFITYILNNFFEKSNEKIVSAYAGEVVPSVDGMECYIKEPTIERQMNQIIPILNNGSDYITYANFIADLHNEGCKVFDENKLLATKYWSWCPAINIDMFINTYNYYWIGWDSGEKDMLIFQGEIDVSQLIGTSNPIYNEYTDEGAIIIDKQYEFKNGDRVVFTNDTSNTYNNIPYTVSGLTYNTDGKNDGKGYFKLTPVKMPLVVLDGETNISIDAEGKASYTYTDEKHDISFELQNGMRIMFLNDSNTSYNKIPFMVTGVGSSIKMVNDSYDPYSSLYPKEVVKEGEDGYEQYKENLKKYNKIISKPDYFVMERGCLDGNDWSARNRWVHVKALEVFNIDSISSGSGERGLYHASKPILCYNKDIKLYNYGTFNRGYIIAITTRQLNEVNNKFKSVAARNLGVSDLKTGDNILFKNIEGANPIQLYTVTMVVSKTGSEIVTLKACTNGQEINGKSSNGATVKGDVVKKIDGIFNIPYYYDGYSWVEGQRKNAHNNSDRDYDGINQNPLFDLFDADKVKLDNTVTYPNSTFNGCKLFDYKEADSSTGVYSGDEMDEKGNVVVYGLDRYIINEDDDKNFIFDNHIHTDVFKYTPPLDYEKEITGYKFFKINNQDLYLNDWYLSSSKYNQYIKTQVEVNNVQSFVTIEDEEYYKVTLRYLPSKVSTKKSLKISKNGENVIPEDIIEDGYTVLIKNVAINDTLIFNILTDDDIEELDPNYTFEPPLSLTTNQFNDEIETIGYNNCFDQMIDIMENQVGFIGRANGANNYSSLSPDLSVGTKIIQTSSNIIRTMIIDDDVNTTIRSSVEYAENAYVKFKNKFTNMLDQYYIKGRILEDDASSYENNQELMDEIIIEIINAINVGKEGLLPFYNNGVTHLIENSYIPATPAYLGIANNYEPKITTYNEYIGEEKPTVIIGHDGSLTKAYNNVKDLFILRLETLIYSSINTKFKDTRCGINKYDFLPGYFRKKTYTRDELINTYSTFVDLWANQNNLDYSENYHFDYDLTANPEAWKTWNYTGSITPDGVILHGSYRAVYTYMYDTCRPHSHPWEMLGFSDEPSWWSIEYGTAPYTSSNIVMWKDIENGIIKDGPYAGEYEELKRPGLVEKYLPVDNNGELKSPMDIGIIEDRPFIQNARARWKIGDFGDVEYAYMQTSAFRFAEQIVFYLLRPVEWVETNWDTLNTVTLFKGTSYEQIINAKTEARENISETVMHNELVDGEYVRNIGIQQWISDYALSNTLSISDIADKIRNASVNLGYRCAGFYEKDTVVVSTDTYGIIPEENVHLSLFKSRDKETLTYSAMAITKTKKGYMIDGFDKSFPYFMVRVPEINGKKATYSTSGATNIVTTSAFIVEDSKPFSAQWLSATKGGDAITPAGSKIYKIITEGDYQNRLYTWNGSIYTEMKSPNRNNGLVVYYPLIWKNEVQKVPYRKEFSTIQEVYNIINGYGKYLEENENWYFNTRNGSGIVMNWRTSSESFVNWADAQKGKETEGNLLLLNPGVLGLGNYNSGMVEDLNLKNCGYNPVLDIYGNPIDADKLNVFRQSFNTFIQPKEDNIGFVKLRTYKLEHLLVLDNTTIYGDVIYDSRYYTILGRFKLFGVKAKNWYGTVYAPGYLLEDVGAIPNFEKSANDLQHIFRVDDAKCQGEKAEYSRAIVGYGKTKTYVDLFRNDKAMFDFYKGAIRHKGTRTVIDKMNRSSYVSSTGNNIEIYENWLFKAGEFGHTRDNSVLEFMLDMKKMRENPQVITFEASNNYYYDETQTYNVGDVVIYHNYEYSCLYNSITGPFNEKDWKQLRYIGNYIIFGNDEKWIKKQRNPLETCFSYTDSLLINPVGGFAQLNDVEYIVADEAEYEEIKDDIAVGETVWIVKLENGDWDIRKKTGVNKFVSMRYSTVEDAYEKPPYENVYHFTDDKKDYYTTVPSDVIDNSPLTPLYSDIDLNDYTCRWCDIGSPMYTGETGQYVTGTDYKVKLYNTVFKTMVPESKVNNSTTLRDLGNDTSITYSNLLLNMTQFGRQFYKYKWRMCVNIKTNCPNIIVNINGQEYRDQKFINIIVCEGDTITWKASAYGCGSKEDTFYIPYTPKEKPEDIPVETSLPTTNLYDGRCIKLSTDNNFYSYQTGYDWIKMGPTVETRQLNITIPLSFRDKTVLADQNASETKEILFCDEGNYEVKLVGAGGGAGGGDFTATKVKRKHGFKKFVHRVVRTVATVVGYIYGGPIGGYSMYEGTAHILTSKKWVVAYYGGCAGAGGAYVDALIPISDAQVTTNTNKYYITCGAGGLGGAFRCDGNCGIDSILKNNATFTDITASVDVYDRDNYSGQTVTDLKHYNTTGLSYGAIVEVLKDEEHSDYTTYYTWDNIRGEEKWHYIGTKDGLILNAEAGMGGAAAFRGGDRIRNGRLLGTGGGYYINPSLDITKNEGIIGNQGGMGSFQGNYGRSVYAGSDYGQGGNFTYGGPGKPGYNGYIKVVYHKGKYYDDYSILSTSVDTAPVSIEIGESDSMEYTSYYQPFVMKYNTQGVTYFYSYDVLYKDETRPNANIIGSSSLFYKNRSKTITGYHKPDVIKNLWSNVPGKIYKEGDTVTHEDPSTHEEKYYICRYNHTSDGTWKLTTEITERVKEGDTTIEKTYTQVVWDEYAPTYYYKIDCNYDAYDLYQSWGPGLEYYPGDIIVIKNNNQNSYYVCVTEHKSADEFTPTIVVEGETITLWKNQELKEVENYRGDWAASTLYNINDIITHDGIDYICTYAHTADSTFSTTIIVEGEEVTVWKETEIRYEAGDTVVIDDVYYDCNVAQLYRGDWAASTEYNINDSVYYDEKYYICTTAHTSESSFSPDNWADKVDNKELWSVREPKKLTNTKPNFIHNGHRFNTELYVDIDCTERATKDSASTKVEDRVMTVLDLQDGYRVGIDYTLVDKFATYMQLTPRYITEPSWGNINQVGTYDVSSGLIEYHINMDKETTESNENALVYADETCLTPVTSIDVDSNEEGTELYYNEVDMKYTDITHVISDHHETSYEMKDNDTYLYTSETLTEILDETPVYSEFELLNQIGVYGDYVPHWEKYGEYNSETKNYTYKPNEFYNNIHYIDYKVTDESINKGNKNYTLEMYADSEKEHELDLFYNERVSVTDERKVYKHLYTPAKCTEDGKVQHNVILYYLNKPEHIVNSIDELPEYVTTLENEIFKVLNNGSNATYYQATESEEGIPPHYKFLGDINTILANPDNDSYFEPYNGDIYVDVNQNTSVMYAETDFDEDIINQNTSLVVDNINNSIKLFYEKQSIGSYVDSNGLIVEADDTENIQIMAIYGDDPMIPVLHDIDRIIEGIHDTDKKIKAIRTIVENYNNSSTYIDVNEVVNFYEQINFTRHGEDTYNEILFKTHTCKVYDYYRNINGENKVYNKLYQYGNELYFGRNVIDDETGDINYVGIYAGNVDDLTTYKRVENVPEEINDDKIVNIIVYKDLGDYVYITHDSYTNCLRKNPSAVSDDYNISKIDGTYGLESNQNLIDKKGWMKIEYIDKDYMFNLSAAQRLRINTDIVKSCYLVDNYDDSTIVKVQVFDPIQNIIPNGVLDEINYISSTDPVNDYTDVGKWNNNKIGYLWWDTSKVRYVDYYQGDYEYRRTTWGKQLPGSEIVINEWTRDVNKPDEGTPYVERTLFDTELDSFITYYYYWKKNPVEKPDVSFRKTPALTIASIINNPTEEGIVWMSPIDSNINGKGENTLVLCNYNNVITGQEAVLQINLDSDKDVLDHTEWVQVKENTNADIPSFLWEKMKDSLLGYKEIDGINQPVPSADLTGRQRLGISYRPRQTMFDKLYNARENFVDIINDIFSSRTYEQINNDMSSWLIKYDPEYPVVDEPNSADYYDEADTKLEMMTWRDEGLIGQNILVKNDETLDGIWAIYRINDGWTYTLVDYQKYNIENYLSLKDWYDNDDVKYLTPTWIVSSSSIDAIELCKTLTEGKMVKYTDGTNWELYQLINNNGVMEVKLVGKSSTLIHISESLYDYVNEGIDNTEPFIVLEDGTTLTKYEYITNETEYLIKMLFEYFDI